MSDQECEYHIYPHLRSLNHISLTHQVIISCTPKCFYLCKKITCGGQRRSIPPARGHTNTHKQLNLMNKEDALWSLVLLGPG